VVFEDVLEFHDILVMQALVNLYFGDEFLAGTVLSQAAFGDDLGRLSPLGVHVGDFVTLGETTFAQQFTADVLPNDLVSIGFMVLFFNNNDRVRIFISLHISHLVFEL